MTRISTKNKKIISTTLKLAETIIWQEITVDKIAKAAKVEPTELLQSFSSKLSILDAFNCQLDVQITKEFKTIERSGSAREQLFDIIMSRFDALNNYKTALKLIHKATVPLDPRASLHGLNSLGNSMKVILNIAGILTTGPVGCVRTKILTAIFIHTYIIWLDDDSADMAKTMAKLDGNLAKAERLTTLITNRI